MNRIDLETDRQIRSLKESLENLENNDAQRDGIIAQLIYLEFSNFLRFDFGHKLSIEDRNNILKSLKDIYLNLT